MLYFSLLYIDHVKLLRGAATSILMDKGFTIPTKEANACLELARLFIGSLGRDRQDLQEIYATFADWVVNSLSKIIDDSKSGGTIDREKLWRKFHCSRNTKDFKSKWMEYLAQLKITDATPLFYQNVSQELFETLISQKCPINNDHGISTECIQHMTLDEENALRYVAGFVIRAAKDKLKVPNDQEILDILNSMAQETSSCSTSTSSEDWVKSVNRGGLVLITEDAHQLFCAIEYCVRSQLHTSNMCSMDSTFRSRLTNSVLSNSEVQF